MDLLPPAPDEGLRMEHVAIPVRETWNGSRFKRWQIWPPEEVRSYPARSSRASANLSAGNDMGFIIVIAISGPQPTSGLSFYAAVQLSESRH